MKKYKVGLFVIVIFSLIGLATLAYLSTKKDEAKEVKNSDCDTSANQTCQVDLKSATTVQTTKTQVGSFGKPQKIEQNVYLSQKLKFKLTFTPAWSEAKIVETIPYGNVEGRVEFKLPTKDQNFNESLATALVIYVFKPGSAPSDDPRLNKINKSGEFEYYFASWRNAPSDLGQITEKEIARIANTLEIVSSN